MAGANMAILIGNVGRDPEIRTTASGAQVAGFSLATSESWKDRTTGERKERTEWHRIVVFGEGLTGIVERFVRKGSRLYVQGQIRTRKWEGSDGVERWTTEIVLSGFDAKILLLDKADGSNRPPPPDDADRYGAGPGGDAGAAGDAGAGSQHPDLDDEIPF